ncbi:MAG: sulfotransferase domain-containing protein, partial [Cyanobacteria bacterium P01_E01_bin.6]
RELINNSYILLICRNPLQRTISSFRLMMEYNRQVKTEDELNQFFLNLIKSENIWIKDQIRYSQYRKVKESYEKSFDKFLLLAYDDIISNPKYILEKISCFLDLDFMTPQMFDFFEQRINSLSMKYTPSPQVLEQLNNLLRVLSNDANELLGQALTH